MTFVPYTQCYMGKKWTGLVITVKPQWLEELWDHGKLFETWVVRANEG